MTTSSKDKFRILHVIPSLKKGGAERLCLDMVIALNKLDGVNAMVAVMENENAYPDLASECEVHFIHSRVVPSLSGKWKIATEGYDQLVAAFKPHVVHSHLFVAEMLTRFKPLAGVHYVSHLHDNMFQFRSLSYKDLVNKKRLTEWYEKRSLIKRYKRCKNTFIAISKHTEAFFKKELPAELAKEIVLLNNAIDVKRFYRTHASDPEERPLRLVMTGSLVNKKNQIFLLDVVAHLRKDFPDVVLDLLGDGPNKEMIAQKIKERNLGNNVFLRGNVLDVNAYLHRAHVYTHSASYEPFGLVLLEAMAAKLPCIALDGGGNLDIIEDGINGFIVNPPDAEKFAEKIKTLMQDKATYLSIVKNGEAYIAKADMQGYILKVLDIYRKKISKQ